MLAVAVPDDTPVTVSAYVVEFAMLPGFVTVMIDVEDDDVEMSYMYDGFPVRFPLSVNVPIWAYHIDPYKGDPHISR